MPFEFGDEVELIDQPSEEEAKEVDEVDEAEEDESNLPRKFYRPVSGYTLDAVEILSPECLLDVFLTPLSRIGRCW